MKKVSAGSAVDMEIKRRRIRHSTLFTHSQDTNVQKRLDFEMRMREGAYKLLLACSQREQVLSASKNLHTSNSRVKAFLSELHRLDIADIAARLSESQSVERLPCHGTVALSGLRIPLLWRDSDHFNNRGSSRRVALFCLMTLGSEICDTDLVIVDRTVTDVCFEGMNIFKEAPPDFELKVELWSCALEEELTLGNTPKKLAKKFRSSFGKSGGKKVCPLLEPPDPEAFLQYNPVPAGCKFSLLAYTALRLPQAEGSFQSHSLTVVQNSEWSSWLPLYGNLCCRLVAQPECMTRSSRTGFLCQKLSVEGLSRSRHLYCELRAGYLSCFFTPEEAHAKLEPTLKLHINQDTRVRVMEKGSAGQRLRTLWVHTAEEESVTFSADSSEELDDWTEALHQHIYDQSRWLQCCDQLMKIEVLSPRKPSLFLTKEADSFYNDLSINSPGKFESITDIIHNRIEETDGRFLIGRGGRRGPPQRSAPSEAPHSAPSEVPFTEPSTPLSSPAHSKLTSTTPSSVKKRRAPPPPCDREPHSPRPARPLLPSPTAPLPPTRRRTSAAPGTPLAPEPDAPRSTPSSPPSSSSCRGTTPVTPRSLCSTSSPRTTSPASPPGPGSPPRGN